MVGIPIQESYGENGRQGGKWAGAEAKADRNRVQDRDFFSVTTWWAPRHKLRFIWREKDQSQVTAAATVQHGGKAVPGSQGNVPRQ